MHLPFTLRKATQVSNAQHNAATGGAQMRCLVCTRGRVNYWRPMTACLLAVSVFQMGWLPDFPV
jgi:hypothetical protein